METSSEEALIEVLAMRNKLRRSYQLWVSGEVASTLAKHDSINLHVILLVVTKKHSGGGAKGWGWTLYRFEHHVGVHALSRRRLCESHEQLQIKPDSASNLNTNMLQHV